MRAGRIALLAGLLLAACSGRSTRDVRVTILDGEGEPIPGALFYAEAYDADGAFAFLAGTAGEAGEVPDSAREPLRLAWREGARIALAAFAPGYRPTVRKDPDRRIPADGAVLVLVPVDRTRGAGPTVAALDFPFPGTPELEAEAAQPRFEALRAAFRAAYDSLRASQDVLSAVEIGKIRALNAID